MDLDNRTMFPWGVIKCLVWKNIGWARVRSHCRYAKTQLQGHADYDLPR